MALFNFKDKRTYQIGCKVIVMCHVLTSRSNYQPKLLTLFVIIFTRHMMEVCESDAFKGLFRLLVDKQQHNKLVFCILIAWLQNGRLR